MRELGTLSDPQAAKVLAGYLQTRAIETRLDPTPAGVTIWVCDEDKVALAREAFQHFLQHPQDERYRNAPAPRAEPRKESKPPRRPSRWFPDLPVTLSLILLSVLITLLFWSGPQRPLIIEYMFRVPNSVESPHGPFEVYNGQVWRLVSPIFIHVGGLWHLVFNSLALFYFASQIERRSGSIRLLLLVLLLAILSNECQYLFSELSIPALLERFNPGKWFAAEAMTPLVIKPSPAFGGISGVVYGLFGYVWMRSVYDRKSELFVSGSNVLILMAWLLLCMTGAVGPIGNVAHVVGLIVGLFAGYVSAWWNRFGY